MARQIRIEFSGAIGHLLAALCILLGTACSDDAISPAPTSTQSIHANENSALKALEAKVGIDFPTDAVLVNATDGGGREPSHQFYEWAVFSPTAITMPVMNQPGVKDYLNLPLENTVEFVQSHMGTRRVEQPEACLTKVSGNGLETYRMSSLPAMKMSLA